MGTDAAATACVAIVGPKCGMAHVRRLRHHVDARQWEYPWFAAWDLAFHCVALAHVDPAFAKYQLILLCREWFQHPNGALPAYEWSFDDVNPPVQAWAALEVFMIDGARDFDFLVARLRQAARQLHVVGEPPRSGRLEHLRGRIPRPRRHRSHRPIAPRAGADARPVGQHRLDGRVRARDGGDRGDAEPQRQPAGDRSRAEVPRALRAHLSRAPHGRPLGRGGRLLLRSPPASRWVAGAAQGAVDRRDTAAVRSRRCRRAYCRQRARRRQASCAHARPRTWHG